MLSISSPENQARVTIVVSFRERWRLTLDTLEAIVRHTPRPYRLWVLDSGMPPALSKTLKERHAAQDMKLVTLEPDLWPNQSRARVAQQVETPYAVFIDNDVLVQPGWLEALLACAEETGAGIVGPLYLWGANTLSDRIHMAGGELTVSEESSRLVMSERHRHINARFGNVQAMLRREECGFAEFHCMLMRREVLQATDTFDPGIVCVHEHIHASLVAKRLGYSTWTEPTARVFYLAQAPWLLGELPNLRQRWASIATERSLRRFAERWNVIDDQRSFGGVRGFVQHHVGAVDPLRSGLQTSHSRQTNMSQSELAQTPAALIMQSQKRGYLPTDLQSIGKACQLAMRISDGGYRPCGRPFLNHLIGTASVLVHYGFALRLVLAALLHAAYSHSRPHNAAKPHEIAASLTKALGGPDAALQRSVRAYTLREQRYPSLLGTQATALELTTEDAELLWLEAANDIDMHLSLEVAATGRSDVANSALLNLMVQACHAVGVAGMGQTLLDARQEADTGLTLTFHSQPGSFRLSADGTVPMARAMQTGLSAPENPSARTPPEPDPVASTGA